MSDKITIRTNNVPRPVLDASELTIKEQREFDYLDWKALEAGEESASFFRYKGQMYDLGEFMTTSNLPAFNPLREWDGYCSNSFFSGIVVKYYNDGEYDHIVVGQFFA